MSNKYIRSIHAIGSETTIRVDVYDVLEAFNVTCPAIQHALKKLLCAGMRGSKTTIQDLQESIPAIERAIDLETQRVKSEKIDKALEVMENGRHA